MSRNFQLIDSLRFRLARGYEFRSTCPGDIVLEVHTSGVIKVGAAVGKVHESHARTEKEVVEAALTIASNSLDRIYCRDREYCIGRTATVAMPRRGGNTSAAIAIASKYKGKLVVRNMQARQLTIDLAKDKLADEDIVTISNVREGILGTDCKIVVFDIDKYGRKEIEMAVVAYDMTDIPLIFVGSHPPVDWSVCEFLSHQAAINGTTMEFEDTWRNFMSNLETAFGIVHNDERYMGQPVFRYQDEKYRISPEYCIFKFNKYGAALDEEARNFTEMLTRLRKKRDSADAIPFRL